MGSDQGLKCRFRNEALLLAKVTEPFQSYCDVKFLVVIDYFEYARRSVIVKRSEFLDH